MDEDSDEAEKNSDVEGTEEVEEAPTTSTEPATRKRRARKD